MTDVPWRTIPEMVLSAADRFGDAEAVVDGALRLSFVELAERIRSAAGAFAEFGIDKGDRVALWAPNSAEWIIAAFGLMTASGVLVPVNTRFKAEEAADVVARSGAKAVLVQNGFLGADFSVATVGLDVPTLELTSARVEPRGGSTDIPGVARNKGGLRVITAGIKGTAEPR